MSDGGLRQLLVGPDGLTHLGAIFDLDWPADGKDIPVMAIIPGPNTVVLVCNTFNGQAKFGVITAVAVA
jgi:hypothetical protein